MRINKSSSWYIGQVFRANNPINSTRKQKVQILREFKVRTMFGAVMNVYANKNPTSITIANITYHGNVGSTLKNFCISWCIGCYHRNSYIGLWWRSCWLLQIHFLSYYRSARKNLSNWKDASFLYIIFQPRFLNNLLANILEFNLPTTTKLLQK